MSFKITEKDLLEHHNFVRSIAIRLLKPEDAEDVAQEAILNALIKPPNNIKKIRPWLKRVTNNLVNRKIRERYREEKKRSKYSIPNEDYSPDQFMLVEQVRSSIISAIYDLPSDQRAAVFLRYYENLKPKEIADQLNTPLETVKSRLKRARENLKKKLDKDYGDRESWLLNVIPLAGFDTIEEAVQSSTFNSSVVIKTSSLSPLLTPVAIAGALALLFIFIAFWWNDFSPLQGPLTTNSNGNSPQLAINTDSSVTTTPENSENSNDPGSSTNNLNNLANPTNTNSTTNSIAEPNLQNVRLVGVVLDEAEVPISDAQLSLESPQGGAMTRHSNGLGKFTFNSISPGSWNLTCRADGFKRSSKKLTLNSKSEEQSVTFVLKKANRSIVRIDTQGMSLAQYQSQISVEQPDRDFDWFHPRHFSVLVAEDSKYEPPLSLGGVVRKNKGSQYKHRAGDIDVHGTLFTEIENPFYLYLIYRNVILKQQVIKKGLEEELTFEVDIENQILPLTSSISVILETAESLPDKFKVHLRDKFTWLQGNGGKSFPPDGVLTLNRLAPGISMLQIFYNEASQPSGNWSITREVVLPASRKAEDLVIKIEKVITLPFEILTPKGVTISPKLKRIALEKDSYPITDDVIFTALLNEDGSRWLFLPKDQIPQIFIAVDRSNLQFASPPIRVPPWEKPKKISFKFMPACELTLRFLMQKSEYERVCIMNSAGDPCWIREVEVSHDYKLSLVPGEYEILMLNRNSSGKLQKADKKSLSLTDGKVDLTIP